MLKQLTRREELDLEDTLDFIDALANRGRRLEEIESILQANGWIVECGMFTLGACNPNKCLSCGFHEHLGQESGILQSLKDYLRTKYSPRKQADEKMG